MFVCSFALSFVRLFVCLNQSKDANEYNYLTFLYRFSTWLEKMPFSNLESRASRLTKRIPLEAGFFACLCSSGCRGNSQLRFCCYPNHIESQVRKSICSTYEVFRYGNGDSYEPLCQGDVIFVTLREGLELSEDTSEDELQLR